jgi:hypothetical protein
MLMQRQLSPAVLRAVIVGSLLGIAIGNVWLHFLEKDLVLAAMLFAVIPLALTVPVAMGARWAPVIVAVLALFYVVGELSGTPALNRLVHPTEVGPFSASALELVSELTAALAGSAAALGQLAPRVRRAS